ncbi:VanW family protein [Paenibacillus puerhi]|uniref:VanW family protein n=1 Tax=Paenibacillus puerhi TaxID=2692622 RepID=UPI00135A88E1|nr:VanW family protein [Paenibacillus puerhi]
MMPPVTKLIGPLLIAILSVTVIACGTAALYGSSQRLPHRLHVGDWVVGGLTFQEFELQLAEKQASFLGLKATLSLENHPSAAAGSKAERTLAELGVELDAQSLIEKTWPLRQGSVLQRAKARWAMRGQAWTVSPSVNTDKLLAALRQVYPRLYQIKPKDAVRVIRPNDTVDYLPEKSTVQPDERMFAERLAASLPSWEQSPTDVPELSVPLRVWNPAITVEMLRAQGIVRSIGHFTTAYPPSPDGGPGSAEGRLHNVQSTAASLQDTLLAPGAVFDYAPFIKQTEEAFGYKEAPVIMNGKLVPGIGGGICQVSSTLYMAVLHAGLEIVERRNHSLPVSYIPLGQDATFATGHINFKFRNNTPHYVLIRTQADRKGLTVKLFGQTPADISYAVESRTIEKLEPPTKFVHNPTLPRGKQVPITPGKPGYIVETYRIKKQNGREIGREKISRDTYSAQPNVIAMNSGGDADLDRSFPAPKDGLPYVEDGVKGPAFR